MRERVVGVHASAGLLRLQGLALLALVLLVEARPERIPELVLGFGSRASTERHAHKNRFQRMGIHSIVVIGIWR